jgi:hypothetical protein
LGAAGAWFVGYEFHGYSCVFVLGWFLDEIDSHIIFGGSIYRIIERLAQVIANTVHPCYATCRITGNTT